MPYDPMPSKMFKISIAGVRAPRYQMFLVSAVNLLELSRHPDTPMATAFEGLFFANSSLSWIPRDGGPIYASSLSPKIALISKNSSKPKMPTSRPLPDCL